MSLFRYLLACMNKTHQQLANPPDSINIKQFLHRPPLFLLCRIVPVPHSTAEPCVVNARHNSQLHFILLWIHNVNLCVARWGRG